MADIKHRYRGNRRKNTDSHSSHTSNKSKQPSSFPSPQKDHTRNMEECTNSKRPARSPLTTKTDAKRHKADYPTPIPGILFTQPATKVIVPSEKAQTDAPSVTIKIASPPDQPAKPAPFLRLPAEIRWQIYQYLFESRRVEIVRRKNKTADPSKPSRYRLYHNLLKPRNPLTQSMLHYGHRSKGTALSFNLVFTCRAIYCETILLLYSTTQFIFNSTNSIVLFLKTTSKDAQAAIRHVELNHIMYNEPRLTAFRTYKIRSDIAWYNACDDMAEAFSSLKVLHIKVAIYDWPIRLEVSELWSIPLLLFGHHDGGLDYAEVQLQMRRFEDEKLKAVARALEQKIMEPKTFQIREDERLARKLGGPVKAKSALRLVI